MEPMKRLTIIYEAPQEISKNYAPGNIYWKLIDDAIFQLRHVATFRRYCCQVLLMPLLLLWTVAKLAKSVLEIGKQIARGAPRFLSWSPGAPYGAL